MSLYFRLIVIVFFTAQFTPSQGQSFQLLKRSDFDLKGPVQSCVVLTKYGREQYTFNTQGYLISAATIFGNKDSETTYYKYIGKRIAEKRFEVFSQGKLDKVHSLASFYTYDSVPSLTIKERVMNYDRKFIDQFTFKFDSLGQVIREINTNTLGRYITEVKYRRDSLQNSRITVFSVDSLPIKRIDSFFNSSKKSLSRALKKYITYQYADGYLKNESRYFLNSKSLVQRVQELSYAKTDNFPVLLSEAEYLYEFNEWGGANQLIIKKGLTSQTKKFIYQLDGSPHGNWIKKITTPDNNYTTRKITYFN